MWLIISAIALAAGGQLKFVGFPSTDGDIIEARLLLPQGTPLARTEQAVAQIRRALEQVDAEFSPRQPDGEPLVRPRISEQFDFEGELAVVIGKTARHVSRARRVLRARRRRDLPDGVGARHRAGGLAG